MTSLKLVDAEGLLEGLFDERSRPSVRWVRTQQKNGTIPYIRIGHLVRFDLEVVRAKLAERHTRRSRNGRSAVGLCR